MKTKKEFIKHLNSILHIKFKGILTIAKETSAWPKLTDPLDKDGMGFDYVWNTGFMQDFLSYILTYGSLYKKVGFLPKKCLFLSFLIMI